MSRSGTERDIESFYLRKYGSTSDSIELTLRQILIKIPRNADESFHAQKKELAQSIFKELKQGLIYKIKV